MRKFSLFFLILLTWQSCSTSDPEPFNNNEKGLPARWADVTLNTVQFTPSNSPTYTSRSLGYIGLTMYECVVHGSADHQTLAGQLTGLTALPIPEAGKDYDWEIALNAGQATIIKSLYPHAFEYIIDVVDSMESVTYQQELATTTPEIAERSVEFGQAVAAAIYEWSKSDGGHEGYQHNFDVDYVFPQGNSYWTPPLFGQSASPFPLHPYWGENRTFVASNGELPVPSIVPYSSNKSSDYYKLFEEVYNKRYKLTREEKRIAAWWADDPTQTASPPGHSYNLATVLITETEADLFTAAETYAKVGMAVADAFVCCWKCKYAYHAERPYPYIRQYIDEDYTQFWPEPPFPAFSSGHATQSAAAAIAMISIFGDGVDFVDNTYDKRHPDFEDIRYVARRYSSIWQTAEECAYSRFLGGIHTRQDNETGTTEGKKIGENVVGLNWRK